ncbi:Acetyltransferase (fragment) [Clostridioides difficile E7]
MGKCGWVFHSPASGSPPVRHIAVPAWYLPLSAAHSGAGQLPRRWDSTGKSARTRPPTHSCGITLSGAG